MQIPLEPFGHHGSLLQPVLQVNAAHLIEEALSHSLRAQ